MPTRRTRAPAESSTPTTSTSSSSRNTIPKNPSPANSSGGSGEPVDLDDLFADDKRILDLDDGDTFLSDALTDSYYDDSETTKRYFYSPNENTLLNNDASLIPGSPFSKPSNKISHRPKVPLALAKNASVTAFFLTLGWMVFLFAVAIENYTSIGRSFVEFFLGFMAFFGLFWNTYFIVSSIVQIAIPRTAFKTNTKFCSIVPEEKPDHADWMEVTIQIPAYKESLSEVLMPTLKSCLAARDHYIQHTGTRCNIVVCDDGLMSFLKDNFAAAELLWESVIQSKGRIIKLSKLLKGVPSASRRHLKGLRSKSVYEAFHRMLFYYHYDIGFVARMTMDRRGKFKKSSNLNAHLRLSLGAAQLQGGNDEQGNTVAEMSWNEALTRESHNDDGSRHIMFGNDIKVGQLIVVTESNSRMAESVILKTVPEFLNDSALGFTQHATRTLTEQRGESYFTKMLSCYNDSMYQGQYLLSSIMGCHPPLIGHSIFLRTECIKQIGRMRTLRKARQWLQNIGLQNVPIDHLGFANLRAENRIEYWSESHVLEGFELMLHLYNLGFDGRYCAFKDCEFESTIARTFDEEAGRHRKFALGAHELCFNSLNEWLGHGIFTPLFGTFMRCDIPAFYKIYLSAYLCSYTAGVSYILVFVLAAITRMIDTKNGISAILTLSPAGIIIFNTILYYMIGYSAYILAMMRMYICNKSLFFRQYRGGFMGVCGLLFVKMRCITFQFWFYTVASLTFHFLGAMDHFIARRKVACFPKKDVTKINRFVATWEMLKFNSGSFLIALVLIGLAGGVFILDEDFTVNYVDEIEYLPHILFSGPAIILGLMCFISPIVLNPYVLGWPFLCRRRKQPAKVDPPKPPVRKENGSVVDIQTFMATAKELDNEMARVQDKPDVELGSLATRELNSGASPIVAASSKHAMRKRGAAPTNARSSLAPIAGPDRDNDNQQFMANDGSRNNR